MEIPFSHKRLFIRIAVTVPLVELALKTIKFRKTLSLLTKLSRKTTGTPDDSRALAVRHANYFYLYHKQVPFLGKCLARSLTLWFLLKRKGVDSELRFGTRKEKGKFLAHAWIEFEGLELTADNESSHKYQMFDENIFERFLN